MDSSSTRRVGLSLIGIGVTAFVVLVGLIVYQIDSSRRLATTNARVRHTFEVIATVQDLDAATQDAERGQRGFLLTGEDSYLQPYRAGVAAIPVALGHLQTLTQDNPEQQRRLLGLQGDITTKLDELSRTIEAARAGDTQDALAIVRDGVGERSMQAILRTINEFTDAENVLLEKRLKAAEDAEWASNAATLAKSGVALLILAAAAVIILGAHSRALRSGRVLQATLDSVGQGIAAFDPAKRLMAWNRPFAGLAGLAPESVRRGRTLRELATSQAPDPVLERLADLDARARRTGHPLTTEWQRQSGQRIEVFHNPIADGGFVTSLIDVTELRAQEAFVRHAQKMESLGQMTGGVAHDFNNLLTIVIGSLETLRRHVGDDSRARELIDRAMIGADRGAKLNAQLLSFARKQPLEPKIVNLGDLLPTFVELLRRSLGATIEIESVGAGGLWNTLVDPAQFESAVLNLALNARDAMPSGGKLTLELANVTLDEAYAARHAELKAGQYVMLAVTDSGTGMAPEIVERAFDPFFTTKPDGQGTGLGLSQVYGFGKQTGGHLKIYSEPGHGTTIKLYLPRHLGDATPVRAGAPAADVSGSETILVVEDDPDVRRTAVVTLTTLGYHVLEAATGAAALTLLEGEQRIDLLFTDVVLPGSVTSRVLAATARELRPNLAVLFTSGYTANAIIHNGRLDDDVQFISKPYRREQLAAKLRAVLAPHHA